MKPLSVSQPWAWAIVNAGKDKENRTRNTHLRGPMAIRASSNLDTEAVLPKGITRPDSEYLDRGAIIGLVGIVDVVSKLSPEWLAGPYGSALENPLLPPEPIAARGPLASGGCRKTMRHRMTLHNPRLVYVKMVPIVRLQVK